MSADELECARIAMGFLRASNELLNARVETLEGTLNAMLFLPSSFRAEKRGQKPLGGARIYELGSDQCKYPIAFIDGEHRFCAAVRPPESPYCREHSALCNAFGRAT